jgi:Putative type VII ESX secretion system translocon, EccE
MSRRYRFGPIERRPLVGPLRAGQFVVIAVGAALGLLTLYALHDLVGMVVALVLLGGSTAAIALPIEGRTAEEWAPVSARWALRRRAATEGWRSSSGTAGARVERGGEARHELSLPPELAGLELLAVPYGSGEVAVMRDGRAGTYTAALAVQGGPFILRDPAEQERALDAWGDVLASTARDGSPVRRVQWLEQTAPALGDELAAHFQSGRDRAVPLESDLVRSYVQLVEAAAPSATDHEVLIAVQIDERRAGRELRRRGGGTEAAAELALREAESLAERLAMADVTVAGLLRPRQYAAHLRDAYDPFGRRGRERTALADPGREGVEPALMGPAATEESWSHYRSDSAWHTTWWISSWPRSDVGPMFLVPLLMAAGVLRTVAVTIEPVPYSVAMRRAEAAQTAEVADEVARARQGFVTTARTRRRAQAVSRREEELADGHAELHFSGWLRAAAPTVAELERAEGEVEHAAALARLGLQRAYGEQAGAFSNTLLLAGGLR